MKVEKFKVLLYLKKSGTDKYDGAVRMQAVVQAGFVERARKPSGRQEPRGLLLHEKENYVMDVKGLAVDTVRHYLAILKKVCRPAW